MGPTTFPGLQTSPLLHQHETMNELINKINPYHKKYDIIKCWANFSLGNTIGWHNHKGSDKSMVYFLENKCNMGPMFKKEGHEVEIPKCPENSLLLFDSNLLHSMPCHLPQDRYSISFELMKK